MAIFNVVATGAGDVERLNAIIDRTYIGSDSYRINQYYWMVYDTISTVEVTKKIGIVGPDKTIPPAVVTKVDSYYGRAPTPLWDWIKAKLEEGADD
ncbi:hypothetical protein [Thalassospira sp.]|uniref:hypothetical protein n=1 Tax=Thalassospira sp. TaxID=1912094 RepID=UPI00273562DA|nr:hypothetical protein [Thalassospira sp.]MDP2697306.1 hypothetical protein [Thalassospira sp.]